MAVKHSCPFNSLGHPTSTGIVLSRDFFTVPPACSLSLRLLARELRTREETNGSRTWRTVVLLDEHRSLISGILLRTPKSFLLDIRILVLPLWCFFIDLIDFSSHNRYIYIIFRNLLETYTRCSITCSTTAYPSVTLKIAITSINLTKLPINKRFFF